MELELAKRHLERKLEQGERRVTIDAGAWQAFLQRVTEELERARQTARPARLLIQLAARNN
jgi:hypothetical protein